MTKKEIYELVDNIISSTKSYVQDVSTENAKALFSLTKADKRKLIDAINVLFFEIDHQKERVAFVEKENELWGRHSAGLYSEIGRMKQALNDIRNKSTDEEIINLSRCGLELPIND